MEEQFEKTKAAPEASTSVANAAEEDSPQERIEVVVDHRAEVEERNYSSLHHPQARVGGFQVYNPTKSPALGRGSENIRIVPRRGPLVQALRPEFGLDEILREVRNHEPLIPLNCGRGCCGGSDGAGKHSRRSSLLGPEFVDYTELPDFPGQELVNVAAELNNVAWIHSGLNIESTRRASS